MFTLSDSPEKGLIAGDTMKKFLCIKDLKIVHRYTGGVHMHRCGDVVPEFRLIQQGIRITEDHFKEVLQEE